MALRIFPNWESDQEKKFLKNLCKLLGHDRVAWGVLRYCARCGKNFKQGTK